MKYLVARLDFDTPNIPREFFHRLRFLKSLYDGSAHFALRRFRSTHGGQHIVITSDERVLMSPLEMVAIQALLGSDYRRECFMLKRVRSLPAAPNTWKHVDRWNTLYEEKLND